MLAYVAWHRPAEGVDPGSYEQALERFHRSLARVPPSGFRGSSAVRVPGAPWDEHPPVRESGKAMYEDWYLLDGWAALGVLEEGAVSRGHLTRHDAVATMAEFVEGGVYRLSDGHPRFEEARVGIWVSPQRGAPAATLGDLLADGMDRERAGLWRRCLALGPAPELCVLASEVPAGVAASRLPGGWRSVVHEREVIYSS